MSSMCGKSNLQNVNFENTFFNKKYFLSILSRDFPRPFSVMKYFGKYFYIISNEL